MTERIVDAFEAVEVDEQDRKFFVIALRFLNRTFETPAEELQPLNLSFSPDGRWLAAGSFPGDEVRVWSDDGALLLT